MTVADFALLRAEVDKMRPKWPPAMSLVAERQRRGPCTPLRALQIKPLMLRSSSSVAAVAASSKMDRLHQAVVSRLYPALRQLRVQRPLSPSACTASSSKCLADSASEPVAPASYDGAAKWLTSATAGQFADDIEALVCRGMAELRITSEGCGGAYFVVDKTAATGASVGIFKPRAEEYMGPENPRGYVQERALVGISEHPVKKGFRIGNGALRERAAYVLDEVYGHFSGVPVTTLMTLPVHGVAKQGSMQQYVAAECSAEDMGTLKFSIPEVQKVGLLDVRLFNTDRHAGNILLHRQSGAGGDQTFGMTPIDHGFCLPAFQHLDAACFDWLYWPQAQFPFTAAAMEHINALDADRDAAILRALGLEEECVTTMRICTAVLQIGARAGFSLFDIGSVMQREGDFSSPSALEAMVARAMAIASEGPLGLSEQADDVRFYDAVVAEVEHAASELFASQPRTKVRSISCFH